MNRWRYFHQNVVLPSSALKRHFLYSRLKKYTTILFWFSIYSYNIYIHYNSINSTMHSTKHWVNIICHSPCLWMCSKCIWQKSKAILPNRMMYLKTTYIKYIHICNAICVSFSHISLKKNILRNCCCYCQKKGQIRMNIGIC